jgi:hypothetical protein
MIKKIVTVALVILAICLLGITDLLIISRCSLADLESANTDKTVQDLDETLATIQWTQPWEKSVFDCSNMSGLLARLLQDRGFKVLVASDIVHHSWVLVKTKEGIQEVESQWRYRQDMNEVNYLTLPTSMTFLIGGFTGEYKYLDSQYEVVK